MVGLITSIAFSLLTYFFLAIIYYGWGQLASFLFGFTDQKSSSPIITIWLGWAFCLLIFQIIHLFISLSALVSVFVFLFGLIFFIIQIKNNFRVFFVLSFARVLFLIVAIWISLRATLPSVNFDSQLYHFNSIRWINTYAIIPGLGNLHGRLAFNQSFFTYVASLNFYPYFKHGRSFANSFLYLLLFATILPSITLILKRPSLIFTEHPFKYIPDFFLLPILLYIVISSYEISSPTPDFASLIIQIEMFVILARTIADWQEGKREQGHAAFVLVFLATTATTIKLSNLFFSFTMIGFVLAYLWITSLYLAKDLFKILIPSFFIISVWLLRGFILSGAPLYPSTIGYSSVDWAIPLNKISNEAKQVFAWAKMPGLEKMDFLDNWKWVYPWFQRIISEYRIDVVYPMIITILFASCAFIVNWHKKIWRKSYLEWSILLPLMIAFICWFFVAPDPRFANAIFYLASIYSVAIFLFVIKENVSKKKFVIISCIVYLGGNFSFFSYFISNRKNFREISIIGQYPIRKEVLFKEELKSSGISIYVGFPPGDSAIPAIPLSLIHHPKLRLRRYGDISSGFTVNEK